MANNLGNTWLGSILNTPIRLAQSVFDDTEDDVVRDAAGNPVTPGGFSYLTGGRTSEAAGRQTAAVGREAAYGDISNSLSWMGQKTVGAAPQDAAKSVGLMSLTPVVAAMAALDTGIRVTNTGIGGGVLLGQGAYAGMFGQLDKAANPLLRDGFQPEDITETFRMMWGQDEVELDPYTGEPVLDENGQPRIVQNSVTAGQAIALSWGRTMTTLVDFIHPDDVWATFDREIAAETRRQMVDPANSRKLAAWTSGLSSEFDIFDYYDRESAFNQGLGRWISGASDAAVQWWLGPDVLAAKVAGKAGRTLFTKSFDSLADIDTLAVEAAQHRAWRAGEQTATAIMRDGTEKVVTARRTSSGELMESLAKLNEQQIARHAIAKTSNNGMLVSRILGKLTDVQDVEKAFRAFAGDATAQSDLFAKDKVAFDALMAQRKHIDDLRELNNLRPEQMLGFGGLNMNVARVQKAAQQADELEPIYKQALEENKALRDFVEATGGRDIGVAPVQFSQVRVSKLEWGPNSVARLENKAIKADRKATTGRSWQVGTFATGGPWGRPVVAFRSGLDYLGTMRQNGVVNLSDNGTSPMDIMDEVDAVFGTTKAIRKITRKGGNGEPLIARIAPDGSGGITYESVTEFRQRTYEKLMHARSANERRAVMQEFETGMYDVLAQYYGMSVEQVQNVAFKYRETRQSIMASLQRNGFFTDGDTLIAMPDVKKALDELELQSMMSENFYLTDFNWLERVIRIDAGSKAAKVAKGTDSVLGSLDSVWRPLVLMRLGYTQRNVAEGWLRELAAYGSLGMFHDASKGSRVMGESDRLLIQWGAGVKRGTDRVTDLVRFRQGSLKKIKRNLQAQQASASRINGEKVAARTRLSEMDQRIADRDKYLEDLARIEEVESRRTIAKALEGSQWVKMTDEFIGEYEDALSLGTEVIISPRFVEPLTQARKKNAARISGEETMEETIVASSDETMVIDEIAGGDYENLVAQRGSEGVDETYSGLLSPDEQSQLVALRERQAMGDPAAEEAVNTLLYRAQFRAADSAMRNGDMVVMHYDDGTYEIVKDLTDFTGPQTDAFGIIRKGNFENAEYVRANVYGSIEDITKTDLTLEDIEKISTGDLKAYERILAFLPEGYAASSPDRAMNAARALLKEMEADPEFARAVLFSETVRRMPKHMREWFEAKGLVADSQVLRRLEKSVPEDTEALLAFQDEVTRAYDDFMDWLDSGEWISDLSSGQQQMLQDFGFSFHGGNIRGNQLSDRPPIDQLESRNLQGMGFYTTEDPFTGATYIVKATDETGDGVFYMTRLRDDTLDIDQVKEENFLDMDEIFPGFEDVTAEAFEEAPDLAARAWEDLQMGQDLYNSMAKKMGIDIDAADVWDEVEQYIIANMSQPAAYGSHNWAAARFGMIKHLIEQKKLQEWNKIKARPGDPGFDQAMIDFQDMIAAKAEKDWAYEAEIAWMDALEEYGIWGITHQGGGIAGGGDRMHQVYIWYKTDELAVESIDEVTDAAKAQTALQHQYRQMEKRLAGKKTNLSKMRRHPVDANRLDAGTMTEHQMQALNTYMAEHGVGAMRVSDSKFPGGTRLVLNRDRISITGDSPDGVLPGELMGRDYGDDLADQLWGETLRSNSSVFNVSDETADTVRAAIDDKVISDALLAKGTTAVKKLTADKKAKLARWMELNDYTHVHAGDNYITVSELIGQRKTGSAYGALFDADELAQRKAFHRTVDPEMQRMLTDRDQIAQDAADLAQRQVDVENQAKATIEKLDKRLGRKGKAQQTKGKRGTGQERFNVQGGEEVVIDGPLAPNEQGELWASLSGADKRVMMDLFGYSDRSMKQFQKSARTRDYVPGEDGYFEELSEQINHYWRNDLVMQELLTNPNISDEEIIATLKSTAQGRAWIRDISGVEDFRELVDKDILTDDAVETVLEKVASNRKVIEDYRVFDTPGLADEIMTGDISPMRLRQNLGWRGDLPTIHEFDMELKAQNLYRRFTGNVMHTLGTLPENALVRHPFFRARWRDEMQRQLDMNAEQLRLKGDWNGRFTQEQIDRMTFSAKQHALKATNETMYTITRMSTPAHMFRFIVPFYPAWASAMKFWLMRMPVEKPENVIRYGMVWNAPNAIGMYQDSDGRRVESASQEADWAGLLTGQTSTEEFINKGKWMPGFIENVNSKMNPIDGEVVVQMTPAIADAVEKTLQVASFGNASLAGNTKFGVSKDSLDFMLQGQSFYVPGLGPLVAMPVNWLASLRPDVAAAFEEGQTPAGEAGKVVYKALLPFGPTKEKDFIDAMVEQWAPSMLNRQIQSMRGMSSAAFSNSAMSIYRDDIVDWEIEGRQGNPPSFLDAVEKAGQFYWFRTFISGTAPFAPSFKSEYSFYTDQWRAIERKWYDLQDFAPNDPGLVDGAYAAAMNEFMTLYGPEFFAMTQSLSGSSSGMGANVGEFKEFDANPALMGDLANIGDDASYITMATRPFAQSIADDGFDPAVYSWQFNRHIEGAPGKNIRSGADTRADLLLDVDTQVGWYEWGKYIDPLEAMYENDQIDYDTMTLVKQQVAKKIGAKYGGWYTQYNDPDGSRSINSGRALDTLLKNDQWLNRHSGSEYVTALQYFEQNRNGLIQILADRKAKGGSDSIEAKSNEDLKLAYQMVVKNASGMDSSGSFINMHNRFFGSDKLKRDPYLWGE